MGLIHARYMRSPGCVEKNSESERPADWMNHAPSPSLLVAWVAGNLEVGEFSLRPLGESRRVFLLFRAGRVRQASGTQALRHSGNKAGKFAPMNPKRFSGYGGRVSPVSASWKKFGQHTGEGDSGG